MRLIYLLLLTTPILAQDVHVRVSPTVTTGIDGTVEFPTIQNALDHHPFAPAGYRVIISIEPGTYHERIDVTQNHQNITLLGLGAHPEDTVITNSLNARQAGGTFFTETAEIDGNGFEADNLTIENTAGAGNPGAGQAVAAAVRADRALFKHVRFLGHQDTLFADYGRQYYLQCFITGSVDFIFGNATAVFDQSTLEANGPGFLTAQSRTSAAQTTGYVILNSRVTTAFEPTPHRLRHPWRSLHQPPPETGSASAVPGAPSPASSTSRPNSPPPSTPPAGTPGTSPPTGSSRPTNPPPTTPSINPPAPAPPPPPASPGPTSSPPPRPKRTCPQPSSPARAPAQTTGTPKPKPPASPDPDPAKKLSS